MMSDKQNSLGSRIKAIRELQQLQQKDLALRAQVTPGFLSQLERGNTGATIETILKIAAALGTPLSQLLETQVHTTAVTRASDRSSQSFGEGHDKWLVTPPTHRGIELYSSRLDPGVSSHEKLYAHGDADEFVLSIEGHMTCQIHDEEYVLTPGDSIQFRSSIPHRLTNKSNESALVIIAVTPSTIGDKVTYTNT